MSRPVLRLRQRPSARIAAWVQALDECEPHSAEAFEIYQEAAQAGLVDELREALKADAARCQNEAAALEAERDRRFP